MASLLSSLLAILLIRWVSEPIPSFTILVLKWLAASLAGVALGVVASGSYKDIRRFATVRSIGKACLSVFVKELVLTLVLLLGWIRLPVAYCVLAVLSDTLMTVVFLVYIRISARMLLKSRPSVKELAQRRTALVAGTEEPSVALCDQLRKQGYEVLGLLTQEPELSGRVISDYVVYYCPDWEALSRLQWRWGGRLCLLY